MNLQIINRFKHEESKATPWGGVGGWGCVLHNCKPLHTPKFINYFAAEDWKDDV